MPFPAAGDFISVIAGTVNSVAGGAWSVSDSKGNTYNIRNRNAFGNAGASTMIQFSSILSTGLGGGDQITVSQSSFGSIIIFMAAYWGKLVTSNDTSNDQTGFGASPNGPNIGLATSDELASYAFGWDSATETLTIPSGYSNTGFTNPLQFTDGGTTLRFAMCWAELLSSGTYTPPSGSLSNNVNWCAQIAATRASSGTSLVQELGSAVSSGGSSVSLTLSAGVTPAQPLRLRSLG